jgi:hypothetical protein
MRAFRFEWTTVALLSVAIIAAMSVGASGEVIRVLAPSSLANAEGPNSGTRPRGPYRVQWLFPASDFAGLPPSHGPLVAWNFRADSAQTQPVDWSFSDVMLWMSATDKTSLTPVYDDNHGPNKTMVHDGPLSFHILGTGPAAGPRDVADGPRLQAPFHYDPSQGNLLIEWLTTEPSLTPSPTLDGLPSPGFARVMSGGPNATSANPVFNTGVFQLEFAALLGDYNDDGTVDAADYVVWRNGLGTTYAESDYEVWRANFGAGSAVSLAGSGARYAFTDPLSSAVPEPATLVLTVLALLSLPGSRLVARTIACS